MKKVYIVKEEFEGTEGIRESQILGVYDSYKKAKDEVISLVENDEYELVKNNGIEINDTNLFRTNFKDGFVEYEIIESEVK